MKGEEGQTVGVGALAHPPLREAVSVLAGVVEVDVVEVSGGRVGRIRHPEVDQTILSDGEQRVQEDVSLVRVVELVVPPRHEDPPDDVVQRLLRTPIGLQGAPGAVV